MRLGQTLVLLAVLAAIATGCKDDERLSILEKRISEAESANKALTTELQTLRFQVEISDWDRIAFMKPGDDGYSSLRFDLGVVTVKIADIKPYANGSKVALQFGNLTSARIDGLKAKLEWGKVNEQGVPQSERIKSREVVFKESLPAGSWTRTELVLDGVPPAELGFVRLREVGHRGIGLRR